MTDTTNPAPDQPAGATAPNTVTVPTGAGTQELTDAAALENDGEQWGPTRAPKTDAADTSASDQRDDPVSQPGRSVSAEGDALAPQGDMDPASLSAGRSESADAEFDAGVTGTPGRAGGGGSLGRGDAASGKSTSGGIRT